MTETTGTRNRWRNYGCIGGSVYRIALTDRYGWPLVYFKGYYNPKRQAYRLYPEKVVVPGAWDITPRWLYWHEFER